MTAFFKEIEPFRGNGNENEKGHNNNLYVP